MMWKGGSHLVMTGQACEEKYEEKCEEWWKQESESR